MPARLSPTRRFPILCINFEPLVWIETHTLHCKAESQLPHRGKPSAKTMLPQHMNTGSFFNTTHTHNLLRLGANTRQSTKSRGVPNTLVWLARNNAWFSVTRCSVLVDPGTIHTPYNHTIIPMCPSLKHFIFSF